MLLLIVDWDTVNYDNLIWGIIIVVFGLIFMISFISFFYVDGYKISSLSGISLAVISCCLILFIGAVFYYQYYSANAAKNGVFTKVNAKVRRPITYQYGRDSQEIGTRLQIEHSDVNPHGASITLQEMWEILMMDKTNNKVRSVIKGILGTDLNDSIDVSYNLLWYLCISEDPFGNNLNRKEILYAASADITELRRLLTTSYTGPSDRASLLFTIISGQVVLGTRGGSLIPSLVLNAEPNERYDEIKQYNSHIVYNLAFIQNKLIDHDLGVYGVQGPYTFLSLQPPSPIENILTSVADENYNSLVQRLGIGPVNGIDRMSEDEKIMHLQGELSLYYNVFTRIHDMEQPPDLRGKTREELSNILSHYTNVELIQSYEPRGVWNSRTELIRLINDDLLGGSKWSIRSVLNCNNDDTMNIMSGESHSETDKSDPEDPTLSYGIHKNYRCFQLSELEGCFRDYDGVFMFRVPDWTPTTIDNITQAPLIREFPLESIKQLKSLLEKEQSNYNVTGLITKIQQGLDMLKSATMQIRNFKNRLEEFTPEQKQIVELYLAWMFTYSMWMRFWKGPGFPWPLTKVRVQSQSARDRGHRSSPQERDEHIFIQDTIRTNIIEMYERDHVLKDWIESLPTIYYDFETTEASCATHEIKTIIDEIALGKYCMGFGSDTILKTSYFYITSLLNHPRGKSFDDFIARMLPRLTDMEYTIITNQLNSMQTPGARLQTLNNRLHALQQPLPQQLTFDTSNYQNNVHVE